MGVPGAGTVNGVPRRVQRFSGENQMNTHNLAIVFGPTLFQTDGKDYKAGRVVEDLIGHYVKIFNVGSPSPPPAPLWGGATRGRSQGMGRWKEEEGGSTPPADIASEMRGGVSTSLRTLETPQEVPAPLGRGVDPPGDPCPLLLR